jgi:hypothetical protein
MVSSSGRADWGVAFSMYGFQHSQKFRRSAKAVALELAARSEFPENRENIREFTDSGALLRAFGPVLTVIVLRF